MSKYVCVGIAVGFLLSWRGRSRLAVVLTPRSAPLLLRYNALGEKGSTIFGPFSYYFGPRSLSAAVSRWARNFEATPS